MKDFPNTKEIEAEARSELRQEDHKRRVAEAVARLRERRGRPWWRRLFPFEITIRMI